MSAALLILYMVDGPEENFWPGAALDGSGTRVSWIHLLGQSQTVSVLSKPGQDGYYFKLDISADSPTPRERLVKGPTFGICPAQDSPANWYYSNS